jgi:hypothetical protein
LPSYSKAPLLCQQNTATIPGAPGKATAGPDDPLLQSIGEPAVATEGMKAVIPFFSFDFLPFTFELRPADD